LRSWRNPRLTKVNNRNKIMREPAPRFKTSMSTALMGRMSRQKMSPKRLLVVIPVIKKTNLSKKVKIIKLPRVVTKTRKMRRLEPLRSLTKKINQRPRLVRNPRRALINLRPATKTRRMKKLEVLRNPPIRVHLTKKKALGLIIVIIWPKAGVELV